MLIYALLNAFIYLLTYLLHCSMSVGPRQMVLGFIPRGPCAVLKDAWTGDNDLPVGLGQPMSAGD